MINLYAFTYPSNTIRYEGYWACKIGQSSRSVDIRMNEQGGSAESEAKLKIGEWNDVKKISGDGDIHAVLKKRGFHVIEGSGKEWFKIPAVNQEEAYQYIDNLIAELEGEKVRKKVILRNLQQKAMDAAWEIIESSGFDSTIIANLCPRFGKTIWVLSLFNKIHEKYGNRVLLLPAYWLSSHTSFENELPLYNDYKNVVVVDNGEDAEKAIAQGKCIMILLSLCGDYDDWVSKNQWIADIDNNDIFMYADEGDFGTHTERQIEKMDYIFS